MNSGLRFCPIGSSPRMRGTANISKSKSMVQRFIPAHAGNSACWDLLARLKAVHPRACGEQQVSRAFARLTHGSSPRMRGTERINPFSQFLNRFIPAHAGNSFDQSRSDALEKVHPRACGEQSARESFPFVRAGSSPRMRGTARGNRNGVLNGRFIPAHAGNRPSARQAGSISTVHPRACGEQFLCTIYRRDVPGSSPRMRGTGTCNLHCGSQVRFIPAHAGNRPTVPCARHAPSVHPRACGEQPSDFSLTSCPFGSSPRMRGTVDRAFVQPSIGRFIPAHAGNRISRALFMPVVSVHPRACGEQHACLGSLHSSDGSSPRMRGTVLLLGRLPYIGRFIPAHAGNSGS